MLQDIYTTGLSAYRLSGLAFTFLLLILTELFPLSILDALSVAKREGSEAATISMADFNGDGYSDLAIGVPDENFAYSSVGAVNVIYGSSDGLSATGLSLGNGRPDQIWSQNSTDIEDEAEYYDHFGNILATGDFNKDGYSDLAIGVPGERFWPSIGVGAVNVIYGSSDGLSATGLSLGNGRPDQMWTQDNPGIEDEAESYDHFGSALATGDFNKDGISDLAIGVPNESIGTISRAGAVNVIYGAVGLAFTSGGLSAIVPLGGSGGADQIWTQNSTYIEDEAEYGDHFGLSSSATPSHVP